MTSAERQFFAGLASGIPNSDCLDVTGCSHGCLWNVTLCSVVEINWGYREHASYRRIPDYTMSLNIETYTEV